MQAFQVNDRHMGPIGITHRNLAEDIPAKRFRHNPFYRLDVIFLRVALLKKRVKEKSAAAPLAIQVNTMIFSIDVKNGI